LTIRTIMLRDSVSAWSSHSPVCTITAVSKDLVRGRLVFHMILVSHLIARIGVSFSRLRHDPPEVTRPVADALVCSYYVRCVSTQRFLADVSVNHSRTGAVKLLITRRDEPSSKLSGYRSPDYSCPGRNWLRSSPAPKG